jgi:hypothetical protein
MNLMFTRSFFAAICTVLMCSSTLSLFAEDEMAISELPTNSNSHFANFAQNLWGQQTGYTSDDAYLYRIHNSAYYHLVAFSDNGDVIQLHDASKWAVHPSHCTKVLYWVQSDDIFIKPKSSCFSSYKYVLHNRTTNEAVEVNLNKEPLPMGEYTFRIVNIEPYNRLIHLSDNTIWQIDAYDSNFPYWQIGQRVLVGVNNNWRDAVHPHILINADMYKEPYSQADFYGYPVGY